MRSANCVFIRCIDRKRLGLHICHSCTTPLMYDLILQDMFDLYYWPTPNGKKISIMLEECGLPYNTIAVDIACFPWVQPYRRLGNDLDRFVNLRRWFDTLKNRPAVRKGTDLGSDWKRDEKHSDSARSIMFGQNSQTVFDAADAAGE